MKCPTKKHLMEEGDWFGFWVQGTVHPSREFSMLRAWNSQWHPLSRVERGQHVCLPPSQPSLLSHRPEPQTRGWSCALWVWDYPHLLWPSGQLQRCGHMLAYLGCPSLRVTPGWHTNVHARPLLSLVPLPLHSYRFFLHTISFFFTTELNYHVCAQFSSFCCWWTRRLVLCLSCYK